MAEPIEEPLQFTSDPMPDTDITFSIDGETFHARPTLPGLRYLKFARMMAEGGFQGIVLVDEFLREVLESSEYERFDKWVNDPSRNVNAQKLSRIVLALWDRYSAGPKEQDRPTQPPEPSTSGQGGTEDSSKANSSSEASTPPV